MITHDKCLAFEAMINKLIERLDEAEEVVAFYAATESWEAKSAESGYLFEGIIEDSDIEDTSDGTQIRFGGKRAREYMNRHK